MAAAAEQCKVETRSEDILGQKWDRCLVDGGIKVATGFALGKTAS